MLHRDLRERLPRSHRLVERSVHNGVMPGAVVLVRQHGGDVLHEAFGLAARVPEERPMSVETIFDLASLTKPLATTATILGLVDRGSLSLDDHISVHLPELRGLSHLGVTIRRLLAHSSGLPGWRPLYARDTDSQSVLALVAQTGIAYEPGSASQYSDVGFVVLGLAAERVGGRSLDVLAQDMVFSPLKLTSTGYRLSAATDRFASTERGNEFERAMLQRAGVEFVGWRTDFYPGEVNDGNAHYALGGVSGNAGLFSTAREVAILAEMWLEDASGAGVLSLAALKAARSRQPTTRPSTRGLGWQLATPDPPTPEESGVPESSAAFFPEEWRGGSWLPRAYGEYMSGETFGHTGFTGSSVWIDPVAGAVIVLLTNATHPTVPASREFGSFRARFHNTVMAELQATGA